MRCAPGLRAVVISAGLSLLGAASANGQAWPAPQGTGAVTVTTQVIENTGHRLTDGFLERDGKSRNVTVAIEADYAVTDRLSIGGGLPYVFARYLGPNPTQANLPVDACRCWHSGWQDISAFVRYSVLDGDFALTPSLSIGTPSHDYQFEGEAVAGYGLTEVRMAVDAGLRLTRISSRLALHGRYAYAVREDVADVPNNRSHWAAGGSAAISNRWSARVTATWQRVHGGLRAGSPTGNPFFPPGDLNTPERVRQHDRLMRDNNWRLGVGTSYVLPHVDVFASYLHFMGGTDTHAGRAVTVGMSVPFARR